MCENIRFTYTEVFDHKIKNILSVLSFVSVLLKLPILIVINIDMKMCNHCKHHEVLSQSNIVAIQRVTPITKLLMI